MKTSAIRKHEPAWHILDAQGQVLGRVATQAANLLRGKDKVGFVPYLDCGDHVVIVNAKNMVLTGRKMEEKAYHRYSGYPGGLKTVTVKELISKRPDDIFTRAIKGMLPKNKLQGEWLKRLHVYAGTEHPHQANIAGIAAK